MKGFEYCFVKSKIRKLGEKMDKKKNDRIDMSIKEQLTILAEPEFQKFSSSLLPGVEHILGVRLPELRKIAKRAAKNDWRAYYLECTQESFEEIMLQGMIIGYIKEEPEIVLPFVQAFVPKINNWSVCDSFCNGLKIARVYQQEVWEFLQPYLKMKQEYHIRFGVVMLLTYYLNEEYIERVLLLLDETTRESYYVKMAVAWAVSACYVRFPHITKEYLNHNTLDDFTFHKSLQKITESQCVDKDTKAIIRTLKRKS